MVSFTGSQVGNWGAPVVFSILIGENKTRVEGSLMHCRESDDSIVVIKFRPVKAGNSLEDKTGMTLCSVTVGCRKCQKRRLLRRDEVQKKITMRSLKK